VVKNPLYCPAGIERVKRIVFLLPVEWDARLSVLARGWR
jgi:hypothetical protein